MSAATETRLRTLIGGDVAGDWYQLTLDGNDVVFTKDESIAKAAAAAMRAKQSFTAELEKDREGRVLITELQVVIEQKPTEQSGAPKAEDRAVATRQTTTPVTASKMPELPKAGLIIDAEALTKQLEHLRAGYHVMSPAIAISQMAPGFGANLAVVQIDSTIVMDSEQKSGSGPDCYYSRAIHGGDTRKRSLRKEGILKLGQAMGVQWVPLYCRRVDDRKHAYLWSWQYFGAVRTHDGQVMPVQGSYELDLRNGSAAAAPMTPAALSKARQNGNEVCESKAMLRTLRNIGIQQSYTVEELKKPFLIVRFSFTPDMSDPEIRKLITQQAMSGIASLYGGMDAAVMTALPAPEPATVEEPETKALPAAKAKVNPFADPQEGTPAATAAPIGGRKVAKVEKKDLKAGPTAKQPGRPFTLGKVIFDNGEEATTLDTKLIDAAEQMQKSGAWVRVTLEPSSRYEGQMNLTAIRALDPNEPDLPLDDDEKEY